MIAMGMLAPPLPPACPARTPAASPILAHPVPARCGTGPLGGYAVGSMTIYAAYGSNMDPAQMLQRCPHSPLAGTGWIKGWRLTFGGEDLGWEGALATIVPDEAATVF